MIGLITLIAQIIILMTRMMIQICKNTKRATKARRGLWPRPSRARLCAAGVGPRGVLTFIGIPMERPTSLFTDNDGVWYVALDATSTSSMTYIMRHVRFLQQAEYDEVTKAFQIEGELNPTDVLTKYKPRPDHERHHAFMMGFPERALEMWRQSTKYKTYKHKKIVAVSSLVEEPHEA